MFEQILPGMLMRDFEVVVFYWRVVSRGMSWAIRKLSMGTYLGPTIYFLINQLTNFDIYPALINRNTKQTKDIIPVPHDIVIQSNCENISSH